MATTTPNKSTRYAFFRAAVRTSLIAVAVIGALANGRAAFASTLTSQTTQTVDERGSEENSFDFTVWDYAHFVGSTPTLTQDFAADSTLIFRLEAPSNTKFVVNPPGPDFGLYFRLQSTNGIVGPYIGGVTMDYVAFEGGEGAVPPTLGYYSQVSTHPFFYIEAGTGVPSPFSFTAMEVSFTFPAGFTPNLVDHGIIYTIRGQRILDTDTEEEFPPAVSNWIQIVPVPEPASLALLGAGGLAMLSRRRRVG